MTHKTEADNNASIPDITEQLKTAMRAIRKDCPDCQGSFLGGNRICRAGPRCVESVPALVDRNLRDQGLMEEAREEILSLRGKLGLLPSNNPVQAKLIALLFILEAVTVLLLLALVIAWFR